MIQMLCDPLRGGNLLADALRQCFQTNQGKIRIERAGHRAERAQIFDADALDECLVAVSFGKTVPFTVAIIADDLLPCGELGESAIRPVKMTAIDNRAANRIAMAGNTFGALRNRYGCRIVEENHRVHPRLLRTSCWER